MTFLKIVMDKPTAAFSSMHKEADQNSQLLFLALYVSTWCTELQPP